MTNPHSALDQSRTASVHDDKHSTYTRLASLNTIPPSSAALPYPHQQQPPLTIPQAITTSTTTKMSLPLTAITKSLTSSNTTSNVTTTTATPSSLSTSYSSTYPYLSTYSFSTPSHPSLTSPSSVSTPLSSSYFTWLVFLEERWTPFDMENQKKLGQTLSLGGTFVDITDTNFPHLERVRVFPKTNYLSYLGVKYRLSRIMQPDAWMDHS